MRACVERFVCGQLAACYAVLAEDGSDTSRSVRAVLGSLVAILEEKGSEEAIALLVEARTDEGLVVLCRSLTHLRSGSYVKGAWYLRRSYLTVTTAERSGAPLDSGMLFALGLFYFGLSLVPPGFHWLLASVGNVVARERGLELLDMAAKSTEGFFGPVAATALFGVRVLFFLDPIEDIDRSSLCEGSPFVRFVEGYALRQAGRLREALEAFKEAEGACSELPQLQLYCVCEVGWCHMSLLQWEEAKTALEHFCTRSTAPSYLSFALYQLGMCQLMCESSCVTDAFERSIAKARSGYSYDEYAKRKSREMIAKRKGAGFGASDWLVFEALTLVEARAYERARQVLNRIEGLECEGDGRVVAYCRGMAFGDAKQLREAVDMSRASSEDWVAPFALVEMAARKEGGEERLLCEAESYRGYDFEKVLKRRIQAMRLRAAK